MSPAVHILTVLGVPSNSRETTWTSSCVSVQGVRKALYGFRGGVCGVLDEPCGLNAAEVEPLPVPPAQFKLAWVG